MAFIQPCFIRKNTPELRKKLEELGYKPFGSVKYEWDTGWGLSTDNRLGEFESFDNNGLENIIKCELPDYEDSIDCGTNEDLFFALATLRDDTDVNQWFIYNTIGNQVGKFETVIWVKCLDVKMEDYFSYDNIYKFMRKATVEEIIEHFKKK